MHMTFLARKGHPPLVFNEARIHPRWGHTATEARGTKMSDKDHPILQRPQRPMSGAGDWDSSVPGVPSRPERPLQIPDNSARGQRTFPVTCIGSPEGAVAAPGDTYAQHEAHSHSVAEPPPKVL
jgi:hypothetical protein